MVREGRRGSNHSMVPATPALAGGASDPGRCPVMTHIETLRRERAWGLMGWSPGRRPPRFIP